MVLDVLTSTIGRYVANLDKNSLKLKVFDGRMELNSLVLDVVAINEALGSGSPIEVARGTIGSVSYTHLTLPTILLV